VRHGFKATAERLAAELRDATGVGRRAQFDPLILARHLGVLILDFAELKISDSARSQLLKDDSDSWSGMTLRDGDVVAIVLNPVHAPTRRSNTLMHELSHVVLKHVPARVDVSDSGLLLLSHYADDAEAEADWLAAALLLPRDALVSLRRRGESAAAIASSFGTSEQLCEWRLRMTGVDTQIRRAR
jgi:Zn-dependent peptidase ImmA (M78 family)